MMRLPMMKNIYEQKNAGGTQYLTLYYVNHEASGRQGKMHLVMNDAKTGKELINIKTSPKVKKDARRYEYRGKDLYVSEEGILLDAGTDEEFLQFAGNDRWAYDGMLEKWERETDSV